MTHPRSALLTLSHSGQSSIRRWTLGPVLLTDSSHHILGSAASRVIGSFGLLKGTGLTLPQVQAVGQGFSSQSRLATLPSTPQPSRKRWSHFCSLTSLPARMATLLTLPPNVFHIAPPLQPPIPGQAAPSVVGRWPSLSCSTTEPSLQLSDPIGPAPEPFLLSHAQCPSTDSDPLQSDPCCHQTWPASNSLLLLLPQPLQPFPTMQGLCLFPKAAHIPALLSLRQGTFCCILCLTCA